MSDAEANIEGHGPDGGPNEPVAVTPFAAQLLRLVRGIVGATPRERALQVVFREVPRPKCLKRSTLALVEDTLRKGVVRWLARRGWPRDRFLHGTGVAAKPVSGSIWERTEESKRELRFTNETLSWLMWMTAENPASTRSRPRIHSTSLTVGDRLVQYLVADVLRDSVAMTPTLRLPAFASNALLWLGWPDAVAKAELEEVPDFEPWTKPRRSWVLEVLQPVLVDRWGTIETEKQKLVDTAALRSIGHTQATVLDNYLSVLESAGRWDLARFIAITLRDLLEGTTRTLPWFSHLNVDSLRMADRAEVYRAGFALLTAFNRLRDWERTARGIGYLDEEYQLAQLWKSDWESWNGNLIAERATEVTSRFQLLTID